MMEWTDRHCRYFLRLISKRALLYTEMITAEAILHGDRHAAAAVSSGRASGGAAARRQRTRPLAEAARIGAEFGYDEINLNVGCPSDRVQSGRFGACLMAEPELVAELRRRDAGRASRCRSRSSAASASTTRMRRKVSIASSTLAAQGRLQHLHRACPQGMARRPEPEGEPRRAADQLWPRLSREARSAGPQPSWSMAASDLSPRRGASATMSMA